MLNDAQNIQSGILNQQFTIQKQMVQMNTPRSGALLIEPTSHGKNTTNEYPSILGQIICEHPTNNVEWLHQSVGMKLFDILVPVKFWNS